MNTIRLAEETDTGYVQSTFAQMSKDWSQGYACMYFEQDAYQYFDLRNMAIDDADANSTGYYVAQQDGSNEVIIFNPCTMLDFDQTYVTDNTTADTTWSNISMYDPGFPTFAVLKDGNNYISLMDDGAMD